jgi:hypothetical protein
MSSQMFLGATVDGTFPPDGVLSSVAVLHTQVRKET